MKRKEKEELLSTNCYYINDDEIDDYIKKYVKLKLVNKAKIASMLVIPLLAFTTIVGVGCYLVRDGVKNSPTMINEAKYVDDNLNYLVQNDTLDDQNHNKIKAGGYCLLVGCYGYSLPIWFALQTENIYRDVECCDDKIKTLKSRKEKNKKKNNYIFW